MLDRLWCCWGGGVVWKRGKILRFFLFLGRWLFNIRLLIGLGAAWRRGREAHRLRGTLTSWR